MKFTKGYKYQLAEDEWYRTDIYPEEDIHTDFISLYKDGRLCGKKGYACDGPSGPTLDRRTNMAPAFGHDMLYQLLRHGLIDKKYRENADRLLAKWCAECGMIKFWADYYYGEGTHDFAAYAANPKNKKKIYEVPSTDF